MVDLINKIMGAIIWKQDRDISLWQNLISSDIWRWPFQEKYSNSFELQRVLVNN